MLNTVKHLYRFVVDIEFYCATRDASLRSA